MRRAETLLIIAGCAFYVWLLHRLGMSSVLHYVEMVGWGLGVTIALEGVARLANTLGWRVAICDYPARLSFSRLFLARVAGEAIDYTTPSAQLGGQFVMAMMVKRDLRLPKGLASVIAATMAEAIGQIGFVIMALLLSARLASSYHELFWPVTGGITLTVGLAAGFFYVQQKQPFFRLWKLATKFGLPRLGSAEVGRSSEEADRLLLDFYENHRIRVMLSCLCYLVAWSLGPLEIYLLLGFLGQPRTVEVALLTEGVGLLIERATFMIPAKLVSQEGGKALILDMLGYAPGIGFAIGLLRRIKELVWVLFGLAIFGIYRLGAFPGATDVGPLAPEAARSAR